MLTSQTQKERVSWSVIITSPDLTVERRRRRRRRREEQLM
jgi:hypothetical protein